MSLNFLITGKKNTLTTKHLKSYLMSIYVNVALDLTNYRTKKELDKTNSINQNLFIFLYII